MSEPIGYVVLFKDQWERVRDIAESNSSYSIHSGKEGDRILVIRDRDDMLIADLGRVQEEDYHWMVFSILDEGCDLIRRAFSIDDEENVH